MSTRDKLLAFGFAECDARAEFRRRSLHGSSNADWLCGEVYVDGCGDSRVCMEPVTLVVNRVFTHATDGRMYAGRHAFCECHALACVEKQDVYTRDLPQSTQETDS